MKNAFYITGQQALLKHVLGPFDEGTDLCCTICETHGAGEFVKIPKGEMWRSSRLWRGAERGQREARPSVKLAYKQELVCKHNEKAQAQALHVLVVPTDMQQGVTCSLCHEEARKHPKLGEELLNSRGNVAPAMLVKMLRPRYVVDL